MEPKKKFEIIEEGRFLDQEEMTGLNGGTSCIFVKHTTCELKLTTGSCGNEHVVYCGPAVVANYSSCSFFQNKTTCQNIYGGAKPLSVDGES